MFLMFTVVIYKDIASFDITVDYEKIM